MKRKIIILLLFYLIFVFSGCDFPFNNRFTIPLEEGLFIYEVDENEKKYFLDHEITYFSLELYADDSLSGNTNIFYDYSFSKPYPKFGCIFIMGLDEEIKTYDLEFGGRCNPNEKNAYSMIIMFLNNDNEYKEYHISFRLEFSIENCLIFNIGMRSTFSSTREKTHLSLSKVSQYSEE